MSNLPGVLAEIAEVAGESAALAVAFERGGTQVYLPPVPAPDHWLSDLIGLDPARAVCERLTCGVGGLRLDLPIGPAGNGAKARARIDAMIAENRSERDIARATGYTIRTVRRRRAALGKSADDRQHSLF